VLVRVDFNVPLANGTEIADDLRIRAALPTLRWLLARGAAVTACTHLGRPKGQPDPRYSVQPVRQRLAELAPEVKLLENLRFEAGETANDPGFVERLVAGHDAYVNDAFGASHRAHASIVGPPRWLPSAAGRLLAREVEVLGGLRDCAPAAVRRRAGRRQGVGQARRDRRAAGDGGRPGDRRSHVLHVPEGQGAPGGRLAVRGLDGGAAAGNCSTGPLRYTCPTISPRWVLVAFWATPARAATCARWERTCLTGGWAWTSAPGARPSSAT